MTRLCAAHILADAGERSAEGDMRAALRGGGIAEVLLCLKGRDAWPELREILRDGERQEMYAAAAALCRLGERDGVELLLGSPADLPTLMALRRPEVWSRLAHVPMPCPLPASWRDLCVAIAKVLGLTLEMPPEDLIWPGWVRLQRVLSDLPAGTTLADNLCCLAAAGAVAIIDGNRLRFVDRFEAVRFWREWLRSNPQ
jgi:hypothetical protein